jgi:ATP-dependent Clp endopeptidase proteolytic subunit ClpP
MSEEKDTRSKKEVAADIALKEAEAALRAAEATKVSAEARKAEFLAHEAELKYHETREKFDRAKSVDEMNFLYRFDGGVDGGSVKACMKKLTEWSRLNPKCDIELVFSSPGGNIIDGFELFDFIQELRVKGHHITTGSLGYAASMAGILLMAGDTRWIGHQSWMMIHRAAFGAYGKTFEIEDEVKFVRRIESRIVDIFTLRSKLSKLKIKRNWDRKDWWISADECLELDLVDEIRGMMPEYKKK